MEKKYNVPVYDLIMDEDSIGLYTVSLVDNPAMECDWYAFSNEEGIKCGHIIDEMEHKVICVICRAEFPILRRDEEGRYFYVKWPKKTINMMAQKFLKDGYQGYINLMHRQDAYVEGVEMEQIFIKDVEKGIDPKEFQHIEDGSLFAVYKIENESIWNDIMNGIYKSVSLEGYFNRVLVEEADETKPITMASLEDLFGYIM